MNPQLLIALATGAYALGGKLFKRRRRSKAKRKRTRSSRRRNRS